jgi:hypothetical protein
MESLRSHPREYWGAVGAAGGHISAVRVLDMTLDLADRSLFSAKLPGTAAASSSEDGSMDGGSVWLSSMIPNWPHSMHIKQMESAM